ncbi:acyltransferase [Leptolyngbya sp. 15MV]|nr:acyltransferase [Leptolyngbya sp. 15MV]
MKIDAVSEPATPSEESRIDILDGWRALSIILVLIAHWFPFPRVTQLNGVAGAAGMAIFFTLSGFLITRLLLKDQRFVPFLVRRLFRIVPLAWAAMLVLALWNGADAATLANNLLFLSNLPPADLMKGGAHLWSLCVEVHFYLGIAILVLVGGRRALYLCPLIMLAITGLRVADGEYVSIVTWHRVDEILAGATLALAYQHLEGRRIARFHSGYTVAVFIGFLAVSHPESGPLQYLRPYFAGLAVGLSLISAPRLVEALFVSRPASYVAQTSYAVYVVHGMLTATWLGGEHLEKWQKYALRPLLAAATFAIAHVSTFQFERRFIALGKWLLRPRAVPEPATWLIRSLGTGAINQNAPHGAAGRVDEMPPTLP